MTDGQQMVGLGPMDAPVVRRRDSLLWALLVPAVVAVALLVLAVGRYTPQTVVDDAIAHATVRNVQTADELKTLRSFYSANVADRAVHEGVPATANFEQQSGAIPAPTTFILDVAQAFSNDDLHVAIVSPYPWSMRRGRALDAFQHEAWNYLTMHPTERFVRRERMNGRDMLRVATADRMEASCVACHNNSPDSPKRDWKVGDVRGIIEVATPIDTIQASASMLSVKLMSGIGFGGLLVLALLAWVSTRVVRPLSQMAAVIHRIRLGELHNRLPQVHRPDEIGAIGRALTALQTQTAERVKAEARISHLAHHDALTGLLNRAAFLRRVDDVLDGAVDGSSRRRGAMLCIDLERFKTVNETYGHVVGDGVLIEVAERLKAAAGLGAFVARLGGDEFAVFQAEGEQPQAMGALAETVAKAMAPAMQVEGQAIRLGVSLGAAIAPDDGSAAETLLKHADMARERARSDGTGTYRFFEPSMDDAMHEHRVRELAVRGALANGELELHYQPLYGLREGRVIGFEALLRWQHPVLGRVSPAEFIPLAEELGLIGAIGGWVLDTACREAAGWPGHLRVAVNVSPLQFRGKAVVGQVAQALSTSGLAPARLNIEVTESVMLDQASGAIDTLHELKAMGVRISMDDFGTGFSSLSYLNSFPFDKIKIDQCFTRGMADTEQSMAIVRAIIGLGESFGMQTTAEGVETVEQFEKVRAEGCDEAQGYLISRPVPALQVSSLFDWQPSSR